MHVRDAVEADADALATRVKLSTDVVRQLIHDRTVRVVEAGAPESADGAGADGPDAVAPDASDAPAPGASNGGPSAFLAYDADEGSVHVTQVAGDREAVSLLLEEPIRFAANEGMPVEVFLPDSQTTAVEAVEAAGFEPVGDRQRLEGEPMRRYRLDIG